VNGGATYTPTATATSSLTVAISLDGTSSGCSLSGSGVVSFTAAGTCLINFNQTGNANYNAASQLQQSITVGKGTQSALTFGTTSYSVAYGNTQTVTATGGSGTGAISYSAGSSTACSVNASTGVVTVTAATGTCSITASKAADANYNAATTATPVTITVSQGTQAALTFGTTSYSLAYGNTQTVTASGGSGTGLLSYSAGTSTACSVDATTGVVTATAASGTCTITANKAADTNYTAAISTNSVAITVTTRPIVITATAAQMKNYGISDPTLAYTITSGSLVNGDTLTGSLARAAGENVGFYPMNLGTLTTTSNPKYSITFGVATDFQIIRVDQASFYFTTTSYTLAYGDTQTVITAGGSGSGGILYSAGSSTACSVNSLGVVTVTNSSGTCSITATKVAESNYRRADTATPVTITVGKASQSITITSTAPTSAAVGGSTYTPAATAPGGGVTISLDGSSSGCSLSGSGVVSFTAAGTCRINFNQTGSANYNAASQVQQSISVGQGVLTLGFNAAPTGVTFGEAAGTHLVSAYSTPANTGTIVYGSNTSTICTVDSSTGALTILAAGTCTITANDSGTTNYSAAAQVSQNITVGKGTFTIGFNAAPTGVTFGEAAGTHSVSASSTPANTGTIVYGSSTSTICTVNSSTGALTILAAGTCTITANDSGTDNYLAATQVTQSITVGKATPLLSAFTVPAQSYGAAPITLTAPTVAGSIAGSFQYSSATTTVATISGNTLTPVNAGSSRITATFIPTNTTNYNNAQISDTVTVGLSAQEITINSTAPNTGVINAATYTPSATALGGTVVITRDSTSTGCSLSNGNVTFTATGTCVLNFNQAGNGNYSAAPQVQQSITQYVMTCSVSGSFYVVGTSIPTYSGKNCKGTVTIPEGIDKVDRFAFANGQGGGEGDTNRDLTGVIFPATTLYTIDQGAFSSLGLTSVTIPTSVHIVGQNSFRNNPLITATVLGSPISDGTYLLDGAFNNQDYKLCAGGTGCPLTLILGSYRIQIAENFGTSTTFANIEFGSGVTDIGKNAFKQNGIAAGWVPIFPATIKTIGPGAFSGSTNLKVIRFGSATTLGITSIDQYAFDPGTLTSVQDCEVPSATTLLHTYLKNKQPQAKIWCLAEKPNAPTGLSGLTSSGQVALSWSAGLDKNEAPTTDYSIQYSTDGGTTWISVSHAASTAISFTVTGLTNGVTYKFRVAGVNIFGSDIYSSVISATPLATALTPTFDTPVSTADGFTVNVTNYSPLYSWESATVTLGSGTVSVGTPSNGKLPLTVTAMAPGDGATISITTRRANYVDGSGVVSTTALKAALIPVIINITPGTGGFTASVAPSVYDSTFQWAVTPSLGSASISPTGAITVSNVLAATVVTLRVSTSRLGYAPGSDTSTVTTLQMLRVIYNAGSATGGSAPTDSTLYASSSSATVLANPSTGGLSLSGNSFVGWTLTQNPINSDPVYQAGASLQLATASVTLYPKWALIPYTVTYKSNGATSGSVPTDSATYTITQLAPIYGNIGNLQRTGYTFIGWGYNSTEVDTLYLSGQSYTVGTNNIEFWARWSANTYTVTYDVNGATGAPSKATDSYTTASTPVTLATVGSMAKTGYNFTGWGLTASSTPVADNYTVTSDTRLFAQWSIANYSVTYLAGANGGGTLPQQGNVTYAARFTVASGTGVTASDAQFTYAFVSWMDGAGATYAPGQSYVMGAAPVILTAQWTRIYNVKYSFNGGSVATPIADQQKIAGDSITVTSVVPTRDGYNFLNWVDQSGETTTATSTYSIRDGHYLLYAQWSPISYTVTYDANGGSPTPTEAQHVIGDIFTLAPAPTRNGYNFAYWSDGGATHYSAGGTYQVGISNIALQAQWTPQVYQISFEFNGGLGSSITPISYTFGTAPATLPSSGPTRTDFTFSGWSVNTTATTGTYSFTPSGDILLHAVWVSSIYRLTFNGGIGVSDTATAKVTIGQAITLPSATKANYTLLGWSTQQSGGNNLAARSSYTPTADVTLYAQWTLQVFTVTFDANHGSASQASANMTYGSPTPIVLPTATRLNYVFNGWYSDPNAGYLIGAGGANYSPTASLTAYAHWIQGSLNGMGAATQIAQLIVHNGIASSFTAGSNGSTVTVNYPADGLPDGTVITAYIEESTARVTPLLGRTANSILSLIIAWVAPDGTVPNTATGKPITMTVFNSGITAGSKVYGLLGNNPSILGVATVDGQVQVDITQDPAVVVAIVSPDAPTSVTSTSIDQSSATISWSAPLSNGGSAITGYTVTSSGGQSCQSTTLSCIMSGLTVDTAYTFTVVATNSLGNSPVSPASASLTLVAPPVVAPPVVTPPVVTPPVVVAPAPAPTPAPVDNSAAIAAAQAAAAQAAAEKKAADEAAAKALADKQAADAKALADKQAADAAKALADKQAADAAALQAAQAQAAAELQAARDKAAAEAAAAADEAAKAQAIADAKTAAEAKALADAAIAAQLAAQKITPEVTLYSISPKLTLSAFDQSYLKKYLTTLKSNATVICIGYTYTERLSLAKATILAKQQATAICAMIKKARPTLHTSILIRPAKSAPVAAQGAKWVAVSYRVDGYQPLSEAKRYQIVQGGLSFTTYRPSYLAGLAFKSVKISQCESQPSNGLTASYASGKKSILITEYGAATPCPMTVALAKGAVRRTIIKADAAGQPGVRITIISNGLTTAELQAFIGKLIPVRSN